MGKSDLAPSGAELRQRQIGGELRPGEPDLLALGIDVPDPADLEPRHLSDVPLRLPPPDNDVPSAEQDPLELLPGR